MLDDDDSSASSFTGLHSTNWSANYLSWFLMIYLDLETSFYSISFMMLSKTSLQFEDCRSWNFSSSSLFSSSEFEEEMEEDDLSSSESIKDDFILNFFSIEFLLRILDLLTLGPSTIYSDSSWLSDASEAEIIPSPNEMFWLHICIISLLDKFWEILLLMFLAKRTFPENYEPWFDFKIFDN